jgi:hypothetical protein
MDFFVSKTQIQVKSDDMVRAQMQVERILAAAARKFDLFDNTVTSAVPNTIKSLVEREHAGFGLGARIVGDLIIVDFNPRGDTSQKFRDIYHDIISKLAQMFPNRIKEVRENESAYHLTSS